MAITFTETTYGSVKKIKAVWVSNGDGDATGTTTKAYDGKLICAVTVPGTLTSQPTDNYDVTVSDGDVDVAIGALADRDQTNTEVVAEASLGAVAGSKLTITVDNAGDTKSGTLYLYVR